MPELPEVERARQVIEDSALDRRIVEVDDTDTYECRPHAPGEIADALVGRRLTTAHRRGKTMWIETSGIGRRRTPGPHLGLHLGMSGRIVVSAPGEEPATPRKPEWDRFRILFEDGGGLRLLDKRRLGRVRLDPDLDALGPDAGEVRVADFRELAGRGHAPIKARLLDQSKIAGIGNLLADQVLWQARIDPGRRTGDLAPDELTVLHRELKRGITHAIAHGGVHTGEVIAHRRRGEHCPRCGAEMRRGTVGGRTTWWCPAEQI